MVGSGDGGAVPPELIQQDPKTAQSTNPTVGNQNLIGSGQAGVGVPGVGEVGFGNSAASAYSSGLGEPLGTQGLQGQDSIKQPGGSRR